MGEITARKRKLIFINILIACIATTMMSTALSTALPPIISELQISATTGQWLSSGYSLGMGIMIPITAFLLTRFRTDRLYETSLLVFIVGLILCIIARGFPMLMFGRILQACANGVLTAMGQVVLLSIYPEEEKGSVMGLYGLSVGAAPVLAPTLIGMCFVQMSTPNMVVVLLNVLRQFSVGLLLMTFVAWGTDKLPGHQVTDGTVLITSLRTIAGSLGMSITVGIMTQISDLTRTSSEIFTIQGLQGAFLFLTLAALVLVFVAAVVMRNRRNSLQDN